FISPSALREITGLTVLGTVQMNWTAAETVKRRHGQYALGTSFATLLCVYGAMLASGLIKT
ncbi:MAG TPA: chain length-determining protein, partial [Telluria sp.]|nr:chain length-determining protein [Telluria sp.]